MTDIIVKQFQEEMEKINQESITKPIESVLTEEMNLINKQLIEMNTRIGSNANNMEFAKSYDYVEIKPTPYQINAFNNKRISLKEFNVTNGILKRLTAYITNTMTASVSIEVPSTKKLNTISGKLSVLYNSGLTTPIHNDFWLFTPDSTNTFPFTAPSDYTVNSYYVVHFFGDYKFSGQLSINLVNESNAPIYIWINCVAMSLNTDV